MLHWGRFYGFLLRFFIDYKRGRFRDDMRVEELARFYPGKQDLIEMSVLPYSVVKTLLTPTVGEMARVLFGMSSWKDLFRKDNFLTISRPVEDYVQALAARTQADIRLSTSVSSVTRDDDGFVVVDGAGESHRFDRVVVATHPLDAPYFLDFWNDELPRLFEGLEKMHDPTVVVVHTDEAIMCGIPRRLWGACGMNFRPDLRQNTVTLHQPSFIGCDEEVFVTYMDPYHLDFSRFTQEQPENTDWASIDWASLPEGCRLDPSKIFDVKLFKHPIFGAEGQPEAFRRFADYTQHADELYFVGVGLDGSNTYGQEGAVVSATQVAEHIRQNPRRRR